MQFEAVYSARVHESVKSYDDQTNYESNEKYLLRNMERPLKISFSQKSTITLRENIILFVSLQFICAEITINRMQHQEQISSPESNLGHFLNEQKGENLSIYHESLTVPLHDWMKFGSFKIILKNSKMETYKCGYLINVRKQPAQGVALINWNIFFWTKLTASFEVSLAWTVKLECIKHKQ